MAKNCCYTEAYLTPTFHFWKAMQSKSPRNLGVGVAIGRLIECWMDDGGPTPEPPAYAPTVAGVSFTSYDHRPWITGGTFLYITPGGTVERWALGEPNPAGAINVDVLRPIQARMRTLGHLNRLKARMAEITTGQSRIRHWPNPADLQWMMERYGGKCLKARPVGFEND